MTMGRHRRKAPVDALILIKRGQAADLGTGAQKGGPERQKVLILASVAAHR
jgi:hypothetical protein